MQPTPPPQTPDPLDALRAGVAASQRQVDAARQAAAEPVSEPPPAPPAEPEPERP